MEQPMPERPLRRGDVVEVRPAAEILATLDEVGALDDMPFMPEMIPFCGRRFTVDRRTEKICETINLWQRSFRIRDAVLLEELRCDGSAHGGCEAGCRFYWKEAWLRRVTPGDPPSADISDGAAVAELGARVAPNTRAAGGADDVRYRCQATEMLKASEVLSTTDPRPYVREYTNGNVSLRTFARVMARAVVMQPRYRPGKNPPPAVRGTAAKTPETAALDLQPGEWVRVKPRPEIEATLTDKGRNRGLTFDREMLQYCGRVLRVQKRVTHIIEEPTGKMLEFGSDCIVLENGVCTGEWSVGRWFCPREVTLYWREAWLERVDPPADSGDGGS
jgi:hypothetical protein